MTAAEDVQLDCHVDRQQKERLGELLMRGSLVEARVEKSVERRE